MSLSGLFIKIFLVAILVSVVGFLIIQLVEKPNSKVEEMKPSESPIVNVYLPQKVTDLENMKWARFQDGRFHTYKLITEESVINIHLPSGRIISNKVINADLIQTNEILDRVYLRLPPETEDYHQAVGNLETELARLSLGKSEECILALNKLKAVEKPDLFSDLYLDCHVSIDNEIEVQTGLKTIQADLKMKWINFLEFSYKPK